MGKLYLPAGNPKYLKYNISEIARLFNLDPTGLGNQLRAHYPDILEWRLKEQTLLGVCTHQQKRVREESRNQYAEAIEMLKSSEATIEEVATKCKVSFSGLKQHLLFYHKDLVRERRKIREKNSGQRYKGKRTGTNTLHEPKKETTEKYASALILYKNSGLTMKEIAAKTNVSYGGFSYYVKAWHRDLIVKRRGITCKEDVETADLNHYKHYRKSSAEKYAGAIETMKRKHTNTAATAKIFGLNSETFRAYLKEHEPELQEANGRMMTPQGKSLSRRCFLKYNDAVEMLRKSKDSYKSIAQKYNINAVSFSSFVRRNYPEIIAKRKKGSRIE